MKNILLVTKIGKNYGALLQAYALKTVLTQQNYNVNIMNYQISITQRSFQLLNKPNGLHSLHGFLRSLIRVDKTKESVRKCLAFRDKYYSFTKPYRNISELRADPPTADIYLVGSDQVWNPNINFNPAYFLMFGSEDTIRASYAASIGLNKIPEEYEAEFCERLKKIQYKSVREKTAEDILSSYGFSSFVHPDPTLLLTTADYDEIAVAPKITMPYILLYFIAARPGFERIKMKLKTLYPDRLIISIPASPTSVYYGDKDAADIGPEEFIGLIKYADSVVTSSFHGTIFSIQYHKNFISLCPKKAGSRISDLLQMTCLSDRLIDDFDKLDQLYKKPNFTYADKVLAENRRGGIQYLQNLGCVS